MKIQLVHTYQDIISLENLLLAWQEFVVGKKNRLDVQLFARDLMDNIMALHVDLVNGDYRHGGYESFRITDSKPRHIHKANVRDRLLHHAIYRILYPFFDRTFIADSFSCRDNKGMHRAIDRFRAMAYQVSRNHTRSCYVLKCDIKKFFASIDHDVLLHILNEFIPDQKIMALLTGIVESYVTDNCGNGSWRVGLPLGNLTSQLFANVYMNVFDQWVKHQLKVKHYIRYADDFVFLSPERAELQSLVPHIQQFLEQCLHLSLHPDKVFIKTVASGVDFLGWTLFADHRVLRHTTKRRMFARLHEHPTTATFQSYFGLLRHGNTEAFRQEVMMRAWIAGVDMDKSDNAW